MAVHVIDEANRCLQCKKPMCQQGCPIHTPIPAMIKALKEGGLEEAGAMLFSNNPMSLVCSLVCNHERQCEGHCVLGRKGQPVHVSSIENYISDTCLERIDVQCQPKNGKKVAVIGAGPAGITIAILLTKKGYSVTIFDSRDKIGGVLQYGIPEFRLPKSIVQAEVDKLKKLGVDFETDMVIGKILTIPELLEDGYETVFVASGAGLPMFMNIPGEGLVGVYSANEYLTRINLMKAYDPDSMTPVLKSKKAAVIGGGNVAMDAARCAKRLGSDVHIVYRRSEAELPARLEEIHHAKEEGIVFDFLTAPISILGDENGRVKSLTCQKMELGEPDASGRRRPVPIPGSEYELDCDMVIMALGTRPNPMSSEGTPDLAHTKKGCVAADPETGATNIPGVYAGGDAATGAATVILAMGAGKRAAHAMADYMLNKK